MDAGFVREVRLWLRRISRVLPGQREVDEVRPVRWPCEKISEVEVEAAISKMKPGKAAGPSDWSKSWLVNVYKGKEDALTYSSVDYSKKGATLVGGTCYESPGENNY